MANIITAGNSTNGGTAISTDTSGTLNIVTGSGSGATAIAVDTSQNVGIGTSSPGKKLDVFNSGTTTTDFVVRNGTVSLLSFVDGAAAYTGTGTNHPLLFTTNNTERMRLDTSGNLMVGQTTLSATTVGFGVNPAGLVNIAQNNSTSGGTGIQIYSTAASAFRFFVTMDGRVNATNTTILAISDIRLKENIQDIDVGLDAVMALKPRKFDWKEGKGKDIKGDRGWIAQEFEQVFPDMVGTWRDEPPEGEEPYKSVGADLIPVLVKAIQELKAELDAVKAKVGV